MDELADDPVAIVAWGENLMHAEALANELRARGLPAVLDPERLAGLRVNRGDTHRAFPVLVPRDRAAEAEGVLARLHGAEGAATEEEIVRALQEPGEAAAAVRSRFERLSTPGAWLVILGALVAVALAWWS